jgi:retron-type reverse transcriptase
VLALDIKKCFPSITPPLVENVFERLSFQGEAAKVLSLLTTFRFQLPQGAPTSPGLANLTLRGIDVRMIGLARQQGFFYTRYVDDLAISGKKRLRKFLRLSERIVQSNGFRLKDKNSLMFQNEPHVITNLIVNRKINLPKSKRAEIQKEAMDEARSGSGKINESTLGKIAWARLINAPFAMRLLERLRAVSQ